MPAHMNSLLLIALFAPLLGSLLPGLLGPYLKVKGTNATTIPLLGLSFLASAYLFFVFCKNNPPPYIVSGYDFGVFDTVHFGLGLMIDRLTTLMMVIVTTVSFLVHVYSVGYMKGDAGYTRFFSYISGFTFAMLSLVMANNFLLLFFGWEGVGLFSYLLIGFWFHRESANFASLKAFIANRVGDLGFLLGIAMVLTYCGSLDYQTVFAATPLLSPHLITLMVLLLFAGAVGKSAQVPLHIWLEGSMEGPTPISALIHAATMVTAGVFMLARLSPMFEYSSTALSVVLIVGALTCFFMGVLGLVQNDIKRVVAYSTLSQLGYMMTAMGASAYAVGLFHLMTHAAFKALLFLAAGSVIIALHHEQDIRKMGGLWKKMPITYVCMLIGALALCGIPPFAGFFSKDMIIDAVQAATVPGHRFAFILVVAATIVTALYTFRMFFLVFHGKTRMSTEAFHHVKESPWTITLPLIVLAIPSVLVGAFFLHDDVSGFFGSSVFVLPVHPAMMILGQSYHTVGQFLKVNLLDWPCLLAFLGVFLSYVLYVRMPAVPDILARRLSWVHSFLLNKYFIDVTYDVVCTFGARLIGFVLYRVGDVFLIDRVGVEGPGKIAVGFGRFFRKWQTGFLYHYAFAMVLGLFIMLTFIWLHT